MKVKAGLSAVMGFFFGGATYFVLRFIEEPKALLFSIWGGLFFYILLFVYFIIHEKGMDRKYAAFEKQIQSPVFHKTNGNFKLHNGKVKNANIYFCEDSMVLISVDEKPYIMEEIPRSDIYRIQCGDIYFNINTNDGRFYSVVMPDAEEVFKILKEKEWIDLI